MEHGQADKAPPDPVIEKTFERCVEIYEDRVIKRELHEEEYMCRLNGDVLRPFWAKERLQNEAATIGFIAEKTTIPVPACQLYSKDGLLHLETKRIPDAVLLAEVDEVARPAAFASVEKEVETLVLPQLRALRRDHIGSVDSSLPVFPPQRVYGLDRRSWERKSSGSSCFVLCHNDLGPQNILVCPRTHQIVGIIDWEFAGYFPPWFELPLWTAMERDAQYQLYADAKWRELDFFGLRGEDLKECIP